MGRRRKIDFQAESRKIKAEIFAALKKAALDRPGTIASNQALKMLLDMTAETNVAQNVVVQVSFVPIKRTESDDVVVATESIDGKSVSDGDVGTLSNSGPNPDSADA